MRKLFLIWICFAVAGIAFGQSIDPKTAAREVRACASAIKVARKDALSLLGEFIKGKQIASKNNVKDMLELENDEISIQEKSLLLDAQQESHHIYKNGTVEVKMVISADQVIRGLQQITHNFDYVCPKKTSNGRKLEAIGFGIMSVKPSLYNLNIWDYVSIRGQLEAKRNAQIDAYRNIAEIVSSIAVDSKNTFGDFFKKNDMISDLFRCAQFETQAIYYKPGLVKVHANLKVEQLIQLLSKHSHGDDLISEQSLQNIRLYFPRGVIRATGIGYPPARYIQRNPRYPSVSIDWNKKLLAAAKNGDFEQIKFCVDQGADLEARDRDKNTALMIVVEEGHYRALARLIALGANIDTVGSLGYTPLAIAVIDGNLEIAELLVNRGANTEAIDEEGLTVLMWALKEGHEKIIELLLAKGANIRAKAKNGDTVLMIALMAKQQNAAKLLIKKGVDIHASNLRGMTVFMWAISNNCREIVDLLLKKGCSVNTRNKYGETPLFFALIDGRYDLASVLIEQGADMEVKNQYGQNLLLWALARNHLEIAKFLMEKGANLYAKDNQGNTVLSLAKQSKNPKLLKLLKSKGMVVDNPDKGFFKMRPYLQWATGGEITISFELYQAKKVKLTACSGKQKKIFKSPQKKRHHIRLKNLLPKTNYNYAVFIQKQNSTWQKILDDQKFSIAGPEIAKFSFFAFGDSQYGSDNLKKLVKVMLQEKDKPHFILGLGDIVQNGKNKQDWYRQFYGPLIPIISEIPFITAIGNHELWGNYGNIGKDQYADPAAYEKEPRVDDYQSRRYKTSFNNFLDHPGKKEGRYYFYFRYGNAIFIVLDSNFPHHAGSSQYKWLKKILQSKEYKEAKWKFLVLHEPFIVKVWDYIYNKKAFERCVNQDGFHHILPLVQKEKFDFVLSGHAHCFQPAVIETVDGHKTHIIVSGGGGGSLDNAIYKDSFGKTIIQKSVLDKNIDSEHHHFLQFSIQGNRLTMKVIGIDHQDKKVILPYQVEVSHD